MWRTHNPTQPQLSRELLGGTTEKMCQLLLLPILNPQGQTAVHNTPAPSCLTDLY